MYAFRFRQSEKERSMRTLLQFVPCSRAPRMPQVRLPMDGLGLRGWIHGSRRQPRRLKRFAYADYELLCLCLGRANHSVLESCHEIWQVMIDNRIKNRSVATHIFQGVCLAMAF